MSDERGMGSDDTPHIRDGADHAGGHHAGADHNGASTRDGDGRPADAARSLVLRELVTRHLAGDGRVDAELRALAEELAAHARASGDTPERLVIGIRAHWRELGLSQSDRLQVASLYDLLLKQSIERYYEGS